MKLIPGLHRIGNHMVAVHLVATSEGVTIIDAGLAGHYRELRHELATLGLGLADVRGIVLTHGDSDHLGFAERLRAEHGTEVWVHEADAARARGEERTRPAWGSMRLAATLGFFAYAMRKGGLRTRFPADVRTFRDGDELPLPGSPRVIAMPGHSPGSVAIHLPGLRALFVGDALTTRHVLTGREGPRPAPFTDDPNSAEQALTHLEGLDVDLVIPGHGPVWHGPVGPMIESYRSHVH